jgi:hypothetical protein
MSTKPGIGQWATLTHPGGPMERERCEFDAAIDTRFEPVLPGASRCFPVLPGASRCFPAFIQLSGVLVGVYDMGDCSPVMVR